MAGTLTISTLSDGTNSTSSTNCIQGSAKAWVNYKGTATVSIRGSYNVSSVTVNNTGDYTINFTNALSNANYSAVGGGTIPAARSFGVSFNVVGSSGAAVPPTTTALRVSTFQPSTNLNADVDYLYVAVFSS